MPILALADSMLLSITLNPSLLQNLCKEALAPISDFHVSRPSAVLRYRVTLIQCPKHFSSHDVLCSCNPSSPKCPVLVLEHVPPSAVRGGPSSLPGHVFPLHPLSNVFIRPLSLPAAFSHSSSSGPIVPLPPVTAAHRFSYSGEIYHSIGSEGKRFYMRIQRKIACS
ncbi:hypothetical protein P5673_016121 [Acropora cervicornis]|uniref:Uncharacterized protein n=1 Tax=Acropora cervicornis TaxID=6130 RepID=A0AAD9QHH6_ACRCE|nr:hypothetical protein P5673_016121 [Acropora cervicornis]